MKTTLNFAALKRAVRYAAQWGDVVCEDEKALKAIRADVRRLRSFTRTAPKLTAFLQHVSTFSAYEEPDELSVATLRQEAAALLRELGATK